MLYNEQGYAAYEEVLSPRPGMLVALVTSSMWVVTEWAPIRMTMEVDFTHLVRSEVPKRGVLVQHYLLWDGQDRLRRFELEPSTHLSRSYAPILLTIH